LREVLFESHLQVRTEFGVQLAIELRTAEEGAQAVERLAKAICHGLALRACRA
jgi:hypothetical protein